ncbi:MAG TPA: N-acetylmuramidase domain-containing protein, partial [Longimicrobiales bacterium]|nr:N-acetylmuramidase domain-containing protein [Longimicrobiales bacterium]
VLDVESGGTAFGADGRLVIRFENHVFWRRWGRDHPEVFQRHFAFDAGRPWQGHRYREAGSGPFAGFHGRQSGEWEAFELARSLDEGAALLSVSMGLPQIMGFNHARLGYGSPKAMFDRFSADVRTHLLGLFDFIKGAGTTSSMLEALRTGRFEHFAARYNGPGQAARYGSLVAARADRFGTLRPGRAPARGTRRRRPRA